MSEVYKPPKLAGEDARAAEQDMIDERAAIMEVDGGLPPEEAAEKAKLPAYYSPDPPAAVEGLQVSNRFLNQWADSFARVTDADRTLVLFSGVGLLSAICHRFFFYAPRPTYPNLFMFILGPSTSPRKTTVNDMARDYLAQVETDLILPDEMTPEAMFSRLSKYNHGVVFSRELNSWLVKMLGKDYNRGLASDLGNIYDHTAVISRETKKEGLLIIQDPVVTILGVGVDEILFPYLKKMDQASGFWPRVTLVLLPPAQEGKPYRMPGKFETMPYLLDKLRAVRDQKEGGEIGYSKVEPLRQAYAADLQREAFALRNNLLVAAHLRLEWILMKFATDLQLIEHPDSREIEPEAFDDAVILANDIKQNLPTFYGDHSCPGKESVLAERVIAYMKKHDENATCCVPTRDLLSSTSADKGDLQRALDRLVVTEQVEAVPIPSSSKGGRPGMSYRRLKP